MQAAHTLNSCQKKALEKLEGPGNVFLTGVAGSGKSFLIRHYLQTQDAESFPVLASTGTAALLVGGRTFHSFFGLGIMQGGLQTTIERAAKNKRVLRRIKKARGIIIDEVSMLPGNALRAAEAIARLARGKSIPWGGLRVIAVGDFAQLPPVTAYNEPRDWAFEDEIWERSAFEPALLRTIVRTKDEEFLKVLNDVREGKVTPRVQEFLNTRTFTDGDHFDGTRLFPHRETTEKYNLVRLNAMEGEPRSFPTRYSGTEKAVNDLKRFAPLPEVLQIKEGALVMLRQNDPQGRWVNGSLGEIQEIDEETLLISLKSGRLVEIEPVSFTLLDADGNEVAAATNFPVNLAYAATIHKAQGLTLDSLLVDLRNLWEPGQAYVALSRVKSPGGLFVSDWSPGSIRVDAKVSAFYRGILERQTPDA